MILKKIFIKFSPMYKNLVNKIESEFAEAEKKMDIYNEKLDSINEKLSFIQNKLFPLYDSQEDGKFSRAVAILENKYALKKSIVENACVDKNGNPIPWYTYPAIEYLKQLDFSDKRIFEFGSGNSSLFWANISKSVTSVEDNKEWFDSRSNLKKSNMKMLYKERGEKYYGSILEENGLFDVIVVDGNFDREKCCESALQKISKNGLIILDNTDWSSDVKMLADSVAILKEANLIQVDFCGFSPINDYTLATSFFFTRDFDFRSKNHPVQPANILGGIRQKKDY